MSEEPIRGLEGVVVSDSTISFIDGQQGILRYRGIAIDELATHSSYEETAYLLLYGGLPTQEQLDAFSAELASERELDDSVWNMLTSFPCWPLIWFCSRAQGSNSATERNAPAVSQNRSRRTSS